MFSAGLCPQLLEPCRVGSVWRHGCVDESCTSDVGAQGWDMARGHTVGRTRNSGGPLGRSHVSSWRRGSGRGGWPQRWGEGLVGRSDDLPRLRQNGVLGRRRAWRWGLDTAPRSGPLLTSSLSGARGHCCLGVGVPAEPCWAGAVCAVAGDKTTASGLGLKGISRSVWLQVPERSLVPAAAGSCLRPRVPAPGWLCRQAGAPLPPPGGASCEAAGVHSDWPALHRGTQSPWPRAVLIGQAASPAPPLAPWAGPARAQP